MKKGLIAIGVALLVLSGCSKFKVAKFVMPSWDTQLAAPLFDHTYTLKEILYKNAVTIVGGDTTRLSIDSASVYSISTMRDLSSIPVGAQLHVGSIAPMSTPHSIGDFAIGSINPSSYGILDNVLANTIAPVPAFDTNAVISPQNANSNIKSGRISSGFLHLMIHNGYPAPVYFNSVSVNLLDGNGNPLPVAVSTIPADSTVSMNLPVNGRNLTSNPEVSLAYGSHGLPSPQTATYQSDTLLAITMAFTNVIFSSADAIIPAQNPIKFNQGIPMPDGNEVLSALIDRGGGSLTISFTNNLKIPLKPVDLVINSLDSQSVPLTRHFNLDTAGAPGSVYNETIDLSGFVLNTNGPSGVSDSFHYSITAGVPGSGGNFANVDSANTVDGRFGISNLSFKSFTGVIHLIDTSSIATDTQKIDLGDFKSKLTGGIKLVGDETKLDLSFVGNAGFPYSVRLRIKPLSSVSEKQIQSEVDTTVIMYPNQKNVVNIGGTFVKVLNNFADTVQMIPDEFVVSGMAVVNPKEANWGETPGTITNTDSIGILNTISLPLNIGIVNGSYSDTTKKTLIYHDSSSAAKMSNIDSGEVHLDVTNGLPLSLTLAAELIDTADGSLDTLSIINIAAPTQFDDNGIVASPIFTPSAVKLTREQAMRFGSSYMRFDFTVNTPNGGTPFPFSANNTLRLKVYANLTFKVDKNLAGGK